MDVRPHGGRFRAIRRIIFAALWTLLASPIQAVLLLFPGRPKIVFVRWYFAVLCRLIGMRIQVVGTPASGPSVLYLSNHSSWVDILGLGAVLDGAMKCRRIGNSSLVFDGGLFRRDQYQPTIQSW